MTPYDSLAAYDFPEVERRFPRQGDPRNARSRYVTDPGGEQHAARIPSPVALAQVFARPLLEERHGTVYRHPGDKARLMAGETTLAEGDVKDHVFAALMGLPERDDLGPYDAYTSLLRIRADDPEASFLRRYAADVAKAVYRRDVFPAPPAPQKAPKAPRTAKTPAQWKADQRARERAAETASARDWLAMYLAEASPGERIATAELHALAVEAIEDLLEDEDDPECEDGTPWRVPGRRLFYAIADEALGARRRSNGVTFYVIPTVTPTQEPPLIETPESIRARADAIREEADALAYSNDELERRLELLDRQREALSRGDLREALETQRERLATRGDGPADFLAFRARRAAA